ncbi:uncharacterized protein BX663DRAFT_516095 [Cokeromyces recurvatus]|uniref:uncharacterized protein n=1 Tax=Cokeromyces recurvatus TaxID=90255 RepID=UPI00221E6ED8|nr:uncharacterized protein BX663DRAFT_516095 [Cokeromyces recurvatus]KAI7901038.1 hypothetical protein BX663DRAFT_516095 [Cokeromyces recurvatus]
MLIICVFIVRLYSFVFYPSFKKKMPKYHFLRISFSEIVYIIYFMKWSRFFPNHSVIPFYANTLLFFFFPFTSLKKRFLADTRFFFSFWDTLIFLPFPFLLLLLPPNNQYYSGD